MHKSVEGMIEQLEADGYTVKIRRERASEAAVAEAREEIEGLRHWNLPARDVRVKTASKWILKAEGQDVSSCGGLTLATIFRGETALVEGKATCSALDVYDRYLGDAKALGRAVSKLEKLT